MDETRMKKLEEMMNVFGGGITKKDFLESFQAVIKLVSQAIQNLTSKVDRKLSEAIAQNERSKEELRKTIVSELGSTKEDVNKAVRDALKEQSNSLNYLRDKVRSLKNGEDGTTPTREELIDLIRPLIPEPLKPDSPEMPKLSVENIEGLDKFVRDRLPTKLGGGGTSDAGVRFSLGRIVKTEVPSGLINGSNKTYTVAADIHAVLSFGINGQVIHSNEYTIAGKTITFSSALPADLSATRFEIIYV